MNTRMKQVRVFSSGKHSAFVLDVLSEVHAVGETVLLHRPEHDRLPIINEMESVMMVAAAVREDRLAVVLAGLEPFLDRHAGAVLVSDLAGPRDEGRTAAVGLGARWNETVIDRHKEGGPI